MIKWAMDHAVSRDGTTIGYRQVGAGPSLVLLPGGMQSSRNFTQLAELLADRFTLHVPDRRGRGLSGPPGPDYGIGTEVDDLSAVLVQTGARDVFALSSGAIATLWTALRRPQMLSRVALYEPPVPVGAPSPLDFVPRYERELAAGNLAAAMVTVMKGTSDRRDWFTGLPRLLLIPMMSVALRGSGEEAVAIRELVPTFHYDAQLIAATAGQVRSFGAIRMPVLLMGGDNSNPYLPMALDALQHELPQAERVELKGVGHIAADNVGEPRLVASELRRFFA
ncbi:Esterase/hydrolase [Bosea sp. 62]|uniref:alpha/beta fold hydrolase n=1 Tax=unclassified Bosea (in: a-proteobacteria) TaxID=2653178 RepID=UPI0012557B17|nr:MULTISPECIES: alpha/beta hydrolase [unclassified Bosea (in: a-proteobacteria)]CAD5249824.1 Esterase/hydrolase [Bosea sp. 46]CAD5250436.1 Esterase/hydrolase [Bosea sp. 21B]CAD5264318.1 Esterase/hydrolase [Bosea sp. 7B]VVT44165.1 Esterase/hydrolase [Bosea sp. EC-HK365B]VXB12383.1 Esterase/hydrolase [Bosea sp. 29B]